ncbi:tetraacyldisaccharide 4'-kinase [Gramella sp. AN32]|uniref:Tetraacyldisaccharide 4'-kinase n=1 Tax=Christiangramia antarctica TaxID=2058158 RepID=A0ABW5X873_9FLAO|nr:tetraacyldisaccharide 4'-kinase [Gramella sp. AN32]MCM4155901.1 tetraacyldisaccharide 4'-kinase [Gramella sp. AN32]
MSNFRKLLFPLSILYDGITRTRNFAYEKGIFHSATFQVSIIAVGNLSVGGTGKSPMIEYLLDLFIEENSVAVLSRGYKRKTKGFRLLKVDDIAADVGDEPLQFKLKFPKAKIAVDANRVEGIENLMRQQPDLILLDDAYQHRKVKADLYILLTTYDELYSKDLVLPAGNLRESKSGAERAEIIVVTKCPVNLSESKKQKISESLQIKKSQQLFFSSIDYSEKIISSEGEKKFDDLNFENFTLVTGIANPNPLLEYLRNLGIDLKHKRFPDHHNFSEKEVQELSQYPKILTTEKDYMRLKEVLPQEQLYYLPIKTKILQDAEGFENLLKVRFSEIQAEKTRQ